MLIFAAVVYCGVALASLFTALRAKGPPGRALAAAAWVALLIGLPMGAAVFSWWWAELDRWDLAMGLGAVLPQAWLATRFLQQPFHQAELVEEPTLVRPLAALAERAGLARSPALLRHRTLGALPAYAWVMRLQHPQVVLADGVVHRLDPPQVEAVLAHEVAHIASGSLWWLMLPPPLAATLALLLMPWTGSVGSLALSLALGVGARRLVSRPTEVLCDRRAGELTSPAAMGEALRRMHALHPMREPGWRGALAWGVASHPHLSERLRALGCGEDRGAAGYARASRVAFAVWGCALLVGFLPVVLFGEDGQVPAAVVWVLTALGLALPARLGTRSVLARRRRLVPPGLPGRRAAGVGLLLLAGGLALLMARVGALVGALAVAVSLPLLLVGQALSWDARRAREQVGKALQHQDLAGAYEVGRHRRTSLRLDPALRLDWALVAVACGHREEGVAALEDLVRRARRLVLAPLQLGAILLHVEPERSLELGRLVAARAPAEPLGWLLQVRALRRLGRVQEAEVAWKAAQELSAVEPGVLVQAAELALDRGEIDAAADRVAQARECGPGESGLLLVEVRLALARGDRAAAEAALARAEALRADNPFAFLDERLAELRAAMAAPTTPAHAPPRASRSG